MRKRMAPIIQSEEERRREVRAKYRQENAADYEPLRDDKKRLVANFTQEERDRMNDSILRQMQKRFGPKGGQFIIYRFIKGSTEEY